MTREVYWTNPARSDLARLQEWIKYYAPGKEHDEAIRIREAIDNLRDFPRIGKRLSVPDKKTEELRQILVAPYVIFYTVEDKSIRIIRLWHYRENRPFSINLH